MSLRLSLIMLLMSLQFTCLFWITHKSTTFQYQQTEIFTVPELYTVPTLCEQFGVTFQTFEVTAYLAIDPYENRYHGITFSGVPAKPYHTVAVDIKVIAIGTWLYIDGLGWRRAEDTGNMIIGKCLDVCVATRTEAMLFGRQPRKVWVPTAKLF